ncbi:Dual specificity/tyrosine protein phosphatase [Trypanosoma melophagium]|uniref:Dual specificity/tyrosine protein phosphatase n=1 Tax=Trypanosoma melophagium TaxID=715481 RepID=UPI003519D821|nr:Dual specificity/tyrosine protein phosphatase [Trypanosoma melophagium]
MPLSLPKLLETQQAIEIIPGVLYFASIGEKLQSIADAVASTSLSPAGSARSQRFQQEDCIEAAAATAAMDASGTSVSSLGRHGRQSAHKGKQGRENFPERSTSLKNLRRARSNVAHSLLLMRQLLTDTNNDKNCGGVLENDVFYFSVSGSQAFQYRPFFADFGPLDISCVTRLSRCLQSLLEYCAGYVWDHDSHGTPVFGPRNGYHKGGEKKGLRSEGDASSSRPIPVVFCSGLQNHERANAACALACFCVATLRWSASVTWGIFQQTYPPMIPFRDASYGVSTFPLTLLDVISGLEKAIALQWYDVRTFDVNAYERLRQYDCNWVVPNTMMAFSSPVNVGRKRPVETYAKLFQELRVTHVVRLNKPLYKRETFLAHGIQHVDLEFPDGTAPNDDIINRFMWTVEPVLLPPPPLWQGTKNEGKNREKKEKLLRAQHSAGKKTNGSSAIAVHCRAGLGRTGTLICVYMMQHYGFTARESIGWIRLCRPGSVMGVQQVFLERLERRLARPTKESDILRAAYHTSVIGSGVVDDISHYTYQLHGFPPNITTTINKNNSSNTNTTTATVISNDVNATTNSTNIATNINMAFSSTTNTSTTAAASSTASFPSPTSPQSSPFSLSSSSSTAPASMFLLLSTSRGLPPSEVAAHSAEQRVAMVELEAMLSDAAYIPRRSIMQSMKYPSSYFLMLEGVSPTRKAFAVQKRFATRRLRARQSTVDHTTVTTQRSTTSNQRTSSLASSLIPPPSPPRGSNTTAVGVAALLGEDGNCADTERFHNYNAYNKYCNAAGDGGGPGSSSSSNNNNNNNNNNNKDNDNSVRHVRNSGSVGNHTNRRKSSLGGIPPRPPTVPLTPWRTTRTVAKITPPRVQVLVQKSRHRKGVPSDVSKVVEKEKTLTGTHSAILPESFHRFFNAQTIGRNGEELAAINASARRLRVPLITPPGRSFLPLFVDEPPSLPRKQPRLSVSLVKQATAADPGWGMSTMRLEE